MTEKEKRKRRPPNRRRLIATGILILIALAGLIAGWLVLRQNTLSGQALRVVYLAPQIGTPWLQVWSASIHNVNDRHMVTASEAGVTIYDVSADGARYVYMENLPEPEIMLIEGDQPARQLTNCGEQDNYCKLIAISEDGRYVVYVQAEEPTIEPSGAPALTLWRIDLDADVIAPRRLLENRDDLSPFDFVDDETLALTLPDMGMVGVNVRSGAIVRDVVFESAQAQTVTGCDLPDGNEEAFILPAPDDSPFVLLAVEGVWLCDTETGTTSLIDGRALLHVNWIAPS